MSKSKEYQQFDDAMRRLISVPHEEIKKQLDAEKAEKKAKKGKQAKHDDARKDRD